MNESRSPKSVYTRGFDVAVSRDAHETEGGTVNALGDVDQTELKVRRPRDVHEPDLSAVDVARRVHQTELRSLEVASDADQVDLPALDVPRGADDAHLRAENVVGDRDPGRYLSPRHVRRMGEERAHLRALDVAPAQREKLTERRRHGAFRIPR